MELEEILAIRGELQTVVHAIHLCHSQQALDAVDRITTTLRTEEGRKHSQRKEAQQRAEEDAFALKKIA